MAALSVNSVRPGTSPCTMRAPSSRAAVALPGMPSVRRGTSELPVTALFAVSEAEMPYTDPLPNSDLFRENRRASL